jgi:uncharacterized membrane protein
MFQGQLKDWVMMGITVFFIGSVLYTIATAIRRKQQNEMQRHMLDKFASARDFADFVQSPVGQKYMMSFSEAATSPTNAILASVRTGVVLVFAGAGIAFTMQATTQSSYLWALGAAIACLGFGFLVSAAISYWLAKKMAQEVKD